MTKCKIEKGVAKAHVHRLAYRAPRLTEFGTVRDLTAAGTGGNAEGMAMTSLRRMA